MAKLVYMNAFTDKVEADAVIPDGMSAETFAATAKAAAEGNGCSVADELLAIISSNPTRPNCFLVVSESDPVFTDEMYRAALAAERAARVAAEAEREECREAMVKARRDAMEARCRHDRLVVASGEKLRATEELARVLGEALRETLKKREPVSLGDSVAADGPEWENVARKWMCLDCFKLADTAAAIHHANGCAYERDVALLPSLPAEEPTK